MLACNGCTSLVVTHYLCDIALACRAYQAGIISVPLGSAGMTVYTLTSLFFPAVINCTRAALLRGRRRHLRHLLPSRANAMSPNPMNKPTTERRGTAAVACVKGPALRYMYALEHK